MILDWNSISIASVPVYVVLTLGSQLYHSFLFPLCLSISIYFYLIFYVLFLQFQQSSWTSSRANHCQKLEETSSIHSFVTSRCSKLHQYLNDVMMVMKVLPRWFGSNRKHHNILFIYLFKKKIDKTILFCVTYSSSTNNDFKIST